MYLVPLKTLLVHAMRETFDGEFPQPDFRSNVNIGIEYPVEKQGYPGIWVDFAEDAPLRQVGVAHIERTDVTGSPGAYRTGTRFRFEGTASFTVVTLSSLERDRLYDELIRTFAFGKEDVATSQFRETIENNDLLAVNAKFDEIQVGGNAAAPGTPWGTDEIIYERTVNLDLIGEFVADPVAAVLVPLSAIIVTPIIDTTIEGSNDPTLPGPDDGKGEWI